MCSPQPRPRRRSHRRRPPSSSTRTAPPASVTAGTTFTVVVAEQDAFGNIETGDSATALALAANNGGGGFSCTTAPAHVTNGIASFSGCSYTVASATAFTLTASSGALTSATANTTVTPGTSKKLVFTTAPPSSAASGTTFSVVVAEEDTFGNIETADSATALSLAANNGGGGFACTTTPTHVTNGVADFSGCSYTVASASAYTLTASSGALTPATATTTVSPGVATKLVYTTAPPGSTTAGATFTVVVAEQDAFGNVETGDSATSLALAANHGGGGFACSDVSDARHEWRRDLHRLQLHEIDRQPVHADGDLGRAHPGDRDHDRHPRGGQPGRVHDRTTELREGRGRQHRLRDDHRPGARRSSGTPSRHRPAATPSRSPRRRRARPPSRPSRR